MTDTGQVPGEGLPENAGMVEQPGVPAPGAYTYLSETTAEDDDLLLLPGAQSAWGNEVAPPAPEPVVEALHEPGAHEMSGRDSGSVDVSAVRVPGPAPIPPTTPRRPLHLGPPTPDASASPVRSLADRGAVGAPPVRQPTPSLAGPEYLDIPGPQPATPWGTPMPAPAAPVSPEVSAAETVVPAPAPEEAQQIPVTPVVDEASVPGAQFPVAGGEPGGGFEAAQAVQPVAEPQVAPADVQAPGAEAVAPEVAVPEAVIPDPEPAAVPEPPVEEAVAPEAPVTVEPVVPDAAQAPEPVVPEAPQAAELPESVVPDAAQVPEGPESVVQDPESVAPRGAEPPESVVPEAPQTADVPEPVVPDVAQVPQVPESVVPDAAQAAEAPEFVVPDAPQTAQAPESVVPDAPQAPEAPESLAPELVPAVAESSPAPEAPHAPEAPYVDASPAPEPAQETPEPPVAFVETSAEPPAEPAAPVVAEAPAAGEAPADTPEPASHAKPASHPEPVPQPGPAPYAEPTQYPEPTTTPHPDPAPVEAHPVPPLAEAPQAPASQAPAPQPYVADPAGPQLRTPEATVPMEPRPGQPLGQFVPVDGQVPTTPHLAPTPPQPTVLPVEEVPEVPAPRAGDPELVQHAEDLDTRAAEQEESTAPVAEARQSTGPAAPAYDDAEREAVLKVMRERRDIRNGFRSDPIPHEVLLRVLEAAHTAPSVGHSQPWDFVVIRSAETRRSMHELAMRQRDAYAKSLPKGRAKQFKELKIEAILDTPVNIVVTADPTRGGRHTLGRHTQPQMAPYSSALAVENLWLAARAEGLGVGWVSFFDEREMVRALGLPDHLEVVAYLCVGYVDEFPDEPELMQAGWSKRRPLSWVVHEETYGRRALPGEDPHDLLGETVAQIRPLDAKALGEAWERQKRMTKPAGALGMLEIISAQLSGLSRQCPPPIPEPAAVAIFAGDHGVHAQGVTPWPQEVTAQMVANFLGGGAVCNAFAGQVGAEVCVVDVGVAADLPATPGLLPRKVRAGTSDMTTGAAMTREEAKQAIEVGIETARDLVAAGNKALLTGEMGIANTTSSAALISVFTGADPAEVTGRGTGINDETLARKTEVVRRALELHQPDPADPIGVLAAIGGFEHAAMVGLLLGGASLRTPVILDGVSAGAAALVARAIAPEVLAACIAGHRSAEPGHVAALNKLGLRPLVDLDLRLGEGTGALLALPLVQSTARAMHEVATFDSAGVTEK
ncbi:nicotinate-nucleotide--dimethylbenzimidazole phosphoribosyltransferase [Streptomyces sp. YS415]|uniref:nicotinate-nucleotide--dimethylbenzimidazole phosphoribosyltransferase n=1 Tax=Streptomyces sp. YS415 TaxID=2944806 RepID=UPI002020FAF9|nr:nicotinate-nucleotide--dimethylbenzimidazole phosphoribosyltransferase [Streptomyces sp. YS415]MCL7429233.1 nicotinate-nucleotide--dimethylbenzimidazole phosphoribosyltransferase [Streptomyces sp. YS415]